MSTKFIILDIYNIDTIRTLDRVVWFFTKYRKEIFDETFMTCICDQDMLPSEYYLTLDNKFYRDDIKLRNIQSLVYDQTIFKVTQTFGIVSEGSAYIKVYIHLDEFDDEVEDIVSKSDALDHHRFVNFLERMYASETFKNIYHLFGEDTNEIVRVVIKYLSNDMNGSVLTQEERKYIGCPLCPFDRELMDSAIDRYIDADKSWTPNRKALVKAVKEIESIMRSNVA